jgi:hypothetical protein
VARLLDRLYNGLDVEGLDGAEVDDFGFDAVFGLELFGGDERLADAAREGYDGEVLSGALDLCFSELQEFVSVTPWNAFVERGSYGNDEVVPLGLLAHGEGETVQKPVYVSEMHQRNDVCNLLVLENNDRVGVADSSLQQTLGILRAVWRDDLQSGNASVPRRVILRVLGSDTRSETVGATEGDVAGLGTTGHVVRLCGGVDDLVNGLHGEVEGHELALSLLSDSLLRVDVSGRAYDGVETSERSTDSKTGKT